MELRLILVTFISLLSCSLWADGPDAPATCREGVFHRRTGADLSTLTVRGWNHPRTASGELEFLEERIIDPAHPDSPPASHRACQAPIDEAVAAGTSGNKAPALAHYFLCVERKRREALTTKVAFERCAADAASCTQFTEMGISRDVVLANLESARTGYAQVNNHLNNLQSLNGLRPGSDLDFRLCDSDSSLPALAGEGGNGRDPTANCSVDTDFANFHDEQVGVAGFCRAMSLVANSGLENFVSDVTAILRFDAERMKREYNRVLRMAAIGRTLNLWKEFVGDQFATTNADCSPFQNGIDRFNRGISTSNGITTSHSPNSFQATQTPAFRQQVVAGAEAVQRLINGDERIADTSVLTRRTLSDLRSSSGDEEQAEVRRREAEIGRLLQQYPYLAVNYNREANHDSVEAWPMLGQVLANRSNDAALATTLEAGRTTLASDYKNYIESICNPEKVPSHLLYRNKSLTDAVTAVTPYKSTQRCIDFDMAFVTRNQQMGKAFFAVACIAPPIALGCGISSVMGAVVDRSHAADAEDRAVASLSVTGDFAGVAGSRSATGSANLSIATEAIFGLIPGGKLANIRRLGTFGRVARGAGTSWEIYTHFRNVRGAATALSSVDYSTINFEQNRQTLEREHPDLFYLEASERSPMVSRLARGYGAIPITNHCTDSDVERLDEIESVLNNRSRLSQADSEAFRRQIVAHIGSVENKEDFLTMVNDILNESYPAP